MKITSRLIGPAIFLIVFVLCVALCRREGQSSISSTFRTTDLQVDNKSTLLGKLQVGPTVPAASEIATFSSTSVTTTGLFNTYSSDTNHVGFAGNNEMIHWIGRNSTTFDTTANAGQGTMADLITNCGQSAGANGVTCRVFAPNATCSTGSCAAYVWDSQFGIMRQDGIAQFGGPSRTASVTLGDAVQRFTVLPTTPTLTTPQLDIGVVASVDGYNMHVKNTATGVSAMGIVLEGDTTVTASVAPQLVLARGAGGAFTKFSLLCSDNGAASCLGAAAADDLVLANYGAGSSLWLAAKDAIHFGTVTVESAQLTTKGHWVATTGNGAPGLDAGCTSGGGAAIVGNDNAFKITTGATSTACTVTFVNTWTQAPICTVTSEAGATHIETISPTQIVFSANQSSKVYNGVCIGPPGST